jgi:uncharacterized protein with HEPN domain
MKNDTFDQEQVKRLIADCEKISSSFKNLTIELIKSNPALAKAVALSLLRFERDYRNLGGRFASVIGNGTHEALQGLAKKIETGLEKINPSEIISALQKTIPSIEATLKKWLSSQEK